MGNMGQVTLAVYGVLMLVGGVMGYVTKKSVPSLVAGILSGILLGVAFALTRAQPKIGYGLGVLTAIGLIVVFIRRYQETHAFMPSGMLCLVSLLAAILLVIAQLQASR